MIGVPPAFGNDVRIGSWVHVPQIQGCPKELVNDTCPVPMPYTYAIESQINVVDLREESGYAHPSIMISCEASRGALVKYSLRIFDPGAKMAGRLGLLVHDQIYQGRGAVIISGQFDSEFGIFDAELSKDQFALIRSAQRSLYVVILPPKNVPQG
jgi:hypothetical protein